jgi:hypothetical protein
MVGLTGNKQMDGVIILLCLMCGAYTGSEINGMYLNIRILVLIYDIQGQPLQERMTTRKLQRGMGLL